MNRSILVVGAHADDIEIQTGGVLLKYRDAGYTVVYVMATNNMSGGVSELLSDGTIRTTREGTVDMMARRKRECDDGARALGTVPIHLDHPQRHYWDEVAQKDVELRYGCALPAGVARNVPMAAPMSMATAMPVSCSASVFSCDSRRRAQPPSDGCASRARKLASCTK